LTHISVLWWHGLSSPRRSLRSPLCPSITDVHLRHAPVDCARRRGRLGILRRKRRKRVVLR
jgi:hypothetical protein